MSRTISTQAGRIPAILLAGSRPGSDPIAAAAGVPYKALVPVGGQPMVARVARTLLDHPRIGAVFVLMQDPEAFTAHPETAWLAQEADITLVVSGAGISQSLLDLMDGTGPQTPFLVTTADNVLLTGAMIDSFLAGAEGSDVAVAMVERRVLLARYPESRRTWLKFRDGWWSGANLFWLGSPQVRRVVAFWRSVEQDRKKGWKVLAAFGPLLLIASALRLLSLGQGMRLAGRRFGLVARPVAMPQAEACIDADKPDDVVLIERILAARSRSVA
ncbi:MAG: 4-diphosphocytidyl-2C-methyl-D-erythritol synthase [Sphingobium sp.]|nr:MAG: 4-diphosphocytidyl-2C-methyl-D-erythritol synthase [Sphingobium sp.]